MSTLTALRFDNAYARLGEAFSTRLDPQPLSDPHLVSVSEPAAELIGLTPDDLRNPEFVEHFAGNKNLEGSEPVAQVYSGHQFGVYVPQLGDGRAHLLGEVVNEGGERWGIQLKGSGLTPYSRMGDGRAVLRSSIREFLISEAMHALGIPTTRALCLVGSDDPVLRETPETAAVVTRLSPSFVRFGTFEFFHHTDQKDRVRELADHVIEHHHPDLANESDRHRLLFRSAVMRTARTIAQWMAVGWSHGVMNSDNMSILGLTIDYGPYGFLDDFDPGFICNHSDHQGRYAFERQPTIGHWNLGCLASALLSLVSEDDLRADLGEYEGAFYAEFESLMAAKLGLSAWDAESDAALMRDLFTLMAQSRVDHTNFYRALCDAVEGSGEQPLRDRFTDREAFDAWWARYSERLGRDGETPSDRAAAMRRANPKFILRNHLAQRAIEAAQAEDFSEVNTLLEILRHPFDEQPGREEYTRPPEGSERHISVSCSS